MKDKIVNKLRAGYSGLFVTSHEEQRCVKEIHEACKSTGSNGFKAHLWTITDGIISLPDKPGDAAYNIPDSNDPIQVFDVFVKLEKKSVLILLDYHMYLENADPFLIRKIKIALADGKTSNRTIVIVGCRFIMPPELEKEFSLIEFKLPDKEQLEPYLEGVARSAGIKLNGNRDTALDAGCGLTTMEFENACAESVAEAKDIVPKVIYREKATTIKKNGLLEIVETDIDLDNVGGYAEEKEWILRRKPAFTDEAKKYGLPTPKGILNVGIPGCLHGDTPIYDPIAQTSRTVAERHVIGEPFHVLAKDDDGHMVVAMALPPLVYPPAPMLNIKFDNGKSITVTHKHRFLTSYGVWKEAFELFETFCAGESVLLESFASSASPSKSHGDVYRCSERGLDSVGNYSMYSHPYDAQLQTAAKICRSSVPSQDDGQPHNQSDSHWRSEHSDDPVPVDKDIAFSKSHRPSKLDSFCHHGRKRYGFETKIRLPLTGRFPMFLQSPVEASQINTGGEPYDPAFRSKPFSSTKSIGYARVLSIEKKPAQMYYDFHVPVFNNYLACGVINHNCGKTHLCKSIANLLSRPLLKLDAGKLFGSLVGQSEENTRMVIQIAEAIAPCVLLVDEIEKGLGGSKSSNATDGGTSARVFGTFLQWMQDKTSPVFVVATANDVSQLPPELLRKGRFDELWFVDLPSLEERKEIWAIQIKKFGRKPSQYNLDLLSEWTDGFTGAEIEASYSEALYIAFERKKKEDPRLDDIQDAVKSIIPLSKTMATELNELRKWASSRARSASGRKTINIATKDRKLA